MGIHLENAKFFDYTYFMNTEEGGSKWCDVQPSGFHQDLLISLNFLVTLWCWCATS